MKIVIVGTGYVGLVTGTCLADVGMKVTCVDIDKEKIKNLKKGILSIYEPGLEKLVHRNYQKGRLQFSTSLSESIKEANVIFIAVGTPPGKDNNTDMQYVMVVAREIGENMSHYSIIVTKSTVPVGTSAKVKKEIQDALDRREKDIPFDIASNPEFLKEGTAIDDFMKPDRVVIGVESDRVRKILAELYYPFILNGYPIIFMDIPSAEMTKYAANAMLATKISFMNEVANLCEIIGADINMVRKGIGSDSRIGNKFIYPGIGYGGSCFPKDVKALTQTAHENNYNMRILQSVEEVNNDQKSVLFNKVKKKFGDLSDKHIAIWGLSFKPNTDDMREAPSLVIIEQLLASGTTVTAYDPVAMEKARYILGDRISYAKNEYEALQNADALLLLTEWSQFGVPDFEKIKAKLNNPLIFDGRNTFHRAVMKKEGIEYHCIGVKTTK